MAKRDKALYFRLDARLRLGLDLLTRGEVRAVGQTLALAVQEMLENHKLKAQDSKGVVQATMSYRELTDAVLAHNEVDQLVNLAWSAHNLLNPEERRIWSVIENESGFWGVPGADDHGRPGPFNVRDLRHCVETGLTLVPNRAAIRANWDAIVARARGEDAPFHFGDNGKD